MHTSPKRDINIEVRKTFPQNPKHGLKAESEDCRDTTDFQTSDEDRALGLKEYTRVPSEV